MISFEQFSLSNGLQLVVHYDPNTPLVNVNTMYNIGSKHELPTKTGFAHLFEHLMFEGSHNVGDFKRVMEEIGVNINAWTSQDMTNYHETGLVSTLERILWAESDRMLSLDFNKKSLDRERSIVQEEFKQHYLNVPYGDLWLLLMPMAFGENNLYGWLTIGKTLEHIQEASLEEVEQFFYTYYRPENAYMSIAGGVEPQKAFELVEKWYGDIPRSKYKRPKKATLNHLEKKVFQEVKRDVPNELFIMTLPGVNRLSENFYEYEALVSILGRGKSSPLYQTLVKEKELCNSAGAGHYDLIDASIIYIYAYANPGVSLKTIEDEIWTLIESFKDSITDKDVQKFKNKSLKDSAFAYTYITNRGEDLAFYELLGDIDRINTEEKIVASLQTNGVVLAAKDALNSSKSAVLYYKKSNA